MKDWQGPAILIFNDAKFSDSDFNSLMQIRVGGKQDDDTKIGKHGLGFNSCYHFTDVPSFISGDYIAFLDPQEQFLSERGERGIKGSIPKNGISRKDHLVPFEGIEGIDFKSTFKGTLFRIPLRKKSSKISDSVTTTDVVFKLINNIKTNFSSQLLFLRNVEAIKMSYIPKEATKPQTIPLWETAIIGLDRNIRNKRKYVENGVTQIFQIEIETIDYSDGRQIDKQIDYWMIATSSQQNPKDSPLERYAKKYRLRVLGGIAALFKSLKYDDDYDEYKYDENNFVGIMYSFLSLPDITHLPVHLNGTWAQSSDRGRLLIEANDQPDLDRQKLNWNRHILLEFLPKLHCKLLKEIVDLRINLKEHPISKFWPFPPATRSCPKYAIEYGLKVLQQLLQNEDNFWSPDDDDRVDSLFKLLPRAQIYNLYSLLRNNWDELEVKSNCSIKSLIRLWPIWPTLPDVLQPEEETPLKPVSCGYTLPKNFKRYRTKKSKFYFEVQENIDRRIFNELNVPSRDLYSYTFEDVEFPEEYDHDYLKFLSDILNHPKIAQDLRDKRCFPSMNKKLKKITDLYDYNNIVFRTIFNENLDMFLHHDLLEHKRILSSIGFKGEINQETLTNCALKIDELHRKRRSPPNVLYRGIILIDHLYKNIDVLKLDEGIMRIKFVPISRDSGNHYSMNMNRLNRDRPQILGCFNDMILPKYREVAWSQMPLISEDVIPPSRVLQKYPLLGKPKVADVIEHLRFLYETLQYDDELRNWSETRFRHDVYEVYKWLEKECLDDDDLDLTEYIESSDPLFLNFNINQDPFDTGNWVSVEDLVLNRQPNEEKYVNPSLARYHTMLKRAGAKEVKRPNVKIDVRNHKDNRSTVFEFLLDQKFPLNDFTFIVNGERIKASRYMIAASSEFFREKFVSNPNLTSDTVKDVTPNSVRVLLRYLYDQSIDDAIKSLRDLHSDKSLIYKDLLKLANNYRLDHLKELMESKLSWLVTMSNVKEMKRFAETSDARQLEKYCDQYIIDNDLQTSIHTFVISDNFVIGRRFNDDYDGFWA